MKIFHYMLVAVAALLVASCSDEIDSPRTGDGPVEARFTTNLSEGWTTRAGDTSWSATDEVGITSVAVGTSLATSNIFSKYKVSGTTAPVNLLPTAETETLYYPTDDSSVNFIAFSPYKAPTDNKVIYDAFADQATLAKYEAVNVLYHKGITGYNQSSTDATLAFKHSLSKLSIKLKTIASGTAAIDLANVSAVSVNNLPASVTVDLKDGSFTVGTTVATTAMSSTLVDGSLSAQAVVVPHAGNHTTFKGRTLSVTVDGAASPYTYTLPNDRKFEAAKSYTFEFELTTNGLRMIGESSADWLDGITQWDGTTTLTLPESELAFEWEAVNSKEMSFKTNYSGTPTVKYSDSATDADAGVTGDWISEETTLASTNESGYKKYTYAFALTENAGVTHTAYIHITAGTLTQVVKVKQKGLPNSYMVKPGETVELPVVRANTFTQYMGESNVIDDATAFTGKLLWSDAQGLVTLTDEGTGKSGKIKVAAADKSGNAVVAVIVGGNIVWSWHIWVTAYEPNSETGIWMDRNLGAINATPGANGSTGLYYQWGRKDPFPGSTSAKSTTNPILYNSTGANFTYVMNESNVAELGVPTLTKTQQDMTWTVINPLTYIGSVYTWMTGSTGNDTNWNSTDGQKTIFDPCPEGYRVSQDSSWGGQTDWGSFSWDGTNKGFDIGVIYGGWYPAAGMRDNLDGTLSAQGLQGYNWSTSISSERYAKHLRFDSDGLSISTYSRSAGLPVRCISESAWATLGSN